MNFGVYFSAEDAGRLLPFKDDKLKDTKNSQFKAAELGFLLPNTWIVLKNKL